MSRSDRRASLTFVIVASLTALGLAAVAAHGQAPETPRPNPGAWPASPAAPEGFRAWRHVKAGESQANALHPAGDHHIYANPLALQGYRTGTWPDGAVIAFEVVRPGVAAGAPEAPGQRLRLDAMVRDRSRHAATGGWGYFRWLEPGGRPAEAVLRDPVKSCHACHVASHPDDFVFTTLPAQ